MRSAHPCSVGSSFHPAALSFGADGAERAGRVDPGQLGRQQREVQGFLSAERPLLALAVDALTAAATAVPAAATVHLVGLSIYAIPVA